MKGFSSASLLQKSFDKSQVDRQPLLNPSIDVR